MGGPAYLSAFVSASCTTRYADRSTRGEVALDRELDWQTGLAHGLEQRVQRLHARLRRELGHRALLAEQPDEAVHLSLGLI